MAYLAEERTPVPDLTTVTSLYDSCYDDVPLPTRSMEASRVAAKLKALAMSPHEVEARAKRVAALADSLRTVLHEDARTHIGRIAR